MSLVKLNNNAVKNVTTFGNVTGGSITFIKKLTASSSSTLSFVDGTSSVVLDNTYKEYLFTFNNIHPSTQAGFSFNGSIDAGSNYNVTKTSTIFKAYHNEGGSNDTALYYDHEKDIGQGTGFQEVQDSITADNDSGLCGSLHLFNPSSTTFVKHFMVNVQSMIGTYSQEAFTAGYFNTTSAIDAVQFKMTSGNMDSGDIVLYGIN